MRTATKTIIPLAFATALSLITPPAEAFCGFYVSGADAKLFNNATMVVMMRSGTRTVLSMQNNYQGPPERFAMVVPVPVVLQEENVKTLPPAVFDRVDQLAAPRLVEYWEQDPCDMRDEESDRFMAPGGMKFRAEKKSEEGGLGVTVEAQFEVGEYQVVILSAKDSNGLDTWLRKEKYRIPAGSEPVLRPYVESGSKFFVAKVDPQKVRFEGGQAMLSPLRFHYDTDTFSLPVRLGLLNSGGTQDLIVHVLSPGQRYDVANYANVTVPTNLDVTDETRQRFGSFYAALFDRTLEKHPRAVVTEYAWDAGSCDPCPTPPLDGSDLATLGADVLFESGNETKKKGGRGWGGGFVLTRLHARYGKSTLGEDLVFRAAPPIVGGREFVGGDDGQLETGAKPGDINNFQARYAIRHPWTGPIACDNPQRGIWGGPPDGRDPSAIPAQKLAFVARDAQLVSFVPKGVPELDLLPGAPDAPAPLAVATSPAPEPVGVTPPPSGSGCGGCAVADVHENHRQIATEGGLFALAVAFLRRRRRSSRSAR